MRAVSEAMTEFGSDFSDGLTVTSPSGRAHLAPLADQSALLLEGDRAAVRRLEALARKLNERM